MRISSIKDRPLHLVRLSKQFSTKRYNSWMEKGSVRIEHIAQSLGSLEPTPSPLRSNAMITEPSIALKHTTMKILNEFFLQESIKSFINTHTQRKDKVNSRWALV